MAKSSLGRCASRRIHTENGHGNVSGKCGRSWRQLMIRKSRAKPASPFKRFNSSPEVIRLVVMIYVRFPLSLRNVEDLLFERGIDICHETVWFWWNRFYHLALAI